MKASDAETTAESDEVEVEVEEHETNELCRNGEAEAPTGAALRGRRPPPTAIAEILPEWTERDAIGEARARTMSAVRVRASLSQSQPMPLSYPLLDERCLGLLGLPFGQLTCCWAN